MNQEKRREQLRHKVWRDPIYFLACGFGSGLSPVAPGTAGTLVAIPIYLILASFGTPIYFILLVAMFALGVWISGRVSTELDVKDDPAIVWDEIVGYCLTMILAPVGVWWMIWGFILFRVFDILKPLPIRLLDQRMTGGLGIMLDDILAAVPAAILLHITMFVMSSLGLA